MGRIRRKPRSREVIWAQGPLHRGEIHGQDDVEPGKERAGEIEPQALFGDLLEPGGPRTVEDQGHRSGKEEQQEVEGGGQDQEGDQGIAQVLADQTGTVLAVGGAHQRLDALRRCRCTRR